MKSYAKAGEKVTCVNGHHVATFLRDVAYGEEARAEVIQLVDGSHPKKGDFLPVCPVCHGEAFRLMGGVCHFEDGWRTAEALQ